MGIIGYNSIGGSTPNKTSTSNHALTDAGAYDYVAPANEEVFKLWVYVGGLSGDGSGVQVGVYDITSGAASAPLVASGVLTGLTINGWNSLDITPVALTETNTYAVAHRVLSATDVSLRSTYVTGGTSLSSLTGASALAGTWTDNASSGDVVSIYAETQAASSGLTLDSEPSTIAKGETGVQYTVSGASTAPTTSNTTATLGGESLGNPTSVTGSGPWVLSFNVPLDIALQAGSYTTSITVDGESALSASIPLTVQSGWTNVPLVNPTTGTESILNGYSGDAPVTGDTVEHETVADLTITATGEWVWNPEPSTTQTVARRVILADGTVGATEDATFEVSTVVINSTTPTRLGESFTITTNGVDDLTLASTVTATYGGIALSGMAILSSSTVIFNGVPSGLAVNASHALVLTVDGARSQSYSTTLLAPTGHACVTLSSVGAESPLNGTSFVGNVGGEPNNIGPVDQLIYQTLGDTISFSTFGLATISNEGSLSQGPSVNLVYLDAQDNYSLSPQITVTLPLTGDAPTPISSGTEIPSGTIALGDDGTYSLAQHVDNPSNTTLLYAVASGTLNQGVTLNPNTGLLSVTGDTTNEVQSNITFSVTEVL